MQGTTPKISVVTTNGLDHTVNYDGAGNETGYYAARTYSPRNLMNAVTDTSGEGPAHSITYGYDYRGVRVARTETPTDAGSASRYYFYTPELQLLSSTVDDSNNVWGQSAHTMSTPLVMNREVIWFNGQPVGEFGPPRTPDTTSPLSLHRTFDTNIPANNVFYTFTDHLGTPLIQTDPTTAIVWRAEHEPYGNVYFMRKGSRTDQPLRFPGQEAAMTWEGSEENYNIFRWYQGGWGRYTQTDPLGIRASMNLFGYVNADPVGSLDPFGLCDWQSRVKLFDQAYENYLAASSPAVYNQNSTGARGPVNAACYIITLGKKGASCGGLAVAAYTYLEPYNDDCCKVVVKDRWFLPHTWVELQCQKCKNNWSTIKDYDPFWDLPGPTGPTPAPPSPSLGNPNQWSGMGPK